MIGVVGIICLVVGLIFKALPPHNINSIYGYKTPLSMKNRDTWKESQKYSANSIIIVGLIFVGLAVSFTYLIKDVKTVYQNIMILVGIASIIVFNEVHLNKIFNKDGSRRI